MIPDTITHRGGHLHLMQATGFYIVSALWVPHDRRGQGIGSWLVRKAQSYGALLALTIEPALDMTHSVSFDYLVRFYERHGFKRSKEGFYKWHTSPSAHSSGPSQQPQSAS